MSRPQVHILIPVWGKTYIERLSKHGLRSFGTPGNLPALVRDCDVTIVFLTSSDDMDAAREAARRLSLDRLVTVDCEAIDDLIGDGPYSVTLTLAFTRGVARTGQAMTDIHFLFWNADFVLSDGSLAHLRDLIARGERVVMCGSLRAIAEEVEPRLEHTGYRVREMVGLALRHPHVMTVAKTVNQPHWHSTVANQLFWKVDGNTLIGRFFQIFMFCLRPTRVVERVGGYCDYSFVPLLCPDAPIHVLPDSDHVFLLELQARDQEAEFFREGPFDIDQVAADVGQWATAEHCAMARTPVVFHAEDLPAQTEAIKAESSRYVAEIERRLPRFCDPASHFYWLSGVAVWLARFRAPPRPRELDLTLRAERLLGLKSELRAPEEALAPEPLGERQADGGERPREVVERRRGLPPRVDSLAARIFGRSPSLTWLHPDWRPLQRARDVLKEALNANKAEARTYLLVAEDNWAVKTFPAGPRLLHLPPLLAAAWQIVPPPRIDRAVVYLETSHRRIPLDRILVNLLPAVAEGGEIRVILIDRGLHSNGGWLTEHLRHAATFADPRIADIAWTTEHDHPSRRRYRDSIERAGYRLISGRPLQMLLGGLVMPAAILRHVLAWDSPDPTLPLLAIGRFRLAAASSAAAHADAAADLEGLDHSKKMNS